MQVEVLRTLGHDVRVFAADNTTIERARPLARALLLASSVYSIPSRRALSRLLAEDRYDMVHVHNTVPLLTGSIHDALRNHSPVVVQHLHNYRAFCLTAYAFRDGRSCDQCARTAFTACTVHRCYRESRVTSGALTASRFIDWARHRRSGYAAHAYVANSAFTKHAHVQHGFADDLIWVVHNPCEDLALLLTPRTPEPVAVPKRLTYVGSLLHAKGVYKVLDLAEAMPDWEVRLIGSGVEEETVRRHVASRRLHNVRLLGLLTGVEKVQAWRESFMTVVPSLCAETFGLTVAESYSLAIPVVSTGSGGVAEILQDGATGLVDSFDDLRATAALLRRLWEDRGRHRDMCRAARDKYEAEFTEAHYGRRLEQAQRAILERFAGKRLVSS